MQINYSENQRLTAFFIDEMHKSCVFSHLKNHAILFGKVILTKSDTNYCRNPLNFNFLFTFAFTKP